MIIFNKKLKLEQLIVYQNKNYVKYLIYKDIQQYIYIIIIFIINIKDKEHMKKLKIL